MNLVSIKSLKLLLIGALSFSIVSCGDGINVEIDGVDGPNVSLTNDAVVIDMTFENIDYSGDPINVGIPNLDNSYAEITPGTNGGVMAMVSLSVVDLIDDDVILMDPQTLPGGRPLPGIQSGNLPAVAFTIPEFHDITVYVGFEAFGVFVPFDLGAQGTIATTRFYIAGDSSGNISLVGEDDAGENAGILLLLNIDLKTRKRVARRLNIID